MKVPRARIDALDEGDRVIAEVREAAQKRAEGMAVRDPAREAEIFARVRQRAVERGLDPDRVEAVFRAVVGG